jgi:hypothetical protein
MAGSPANNVAGFVADIDTDARSDLSLLLRQVISRFEP